MDMAIYEPWHKELSRRCNRLGGGLALKVGALSNRHDFTLVDGNAPVLDQPFVFIHRDNEWTEYQQIYVVQSPLPEALG